MLALALIAWELSSPGKAISTASAAMGCQVPPAPGRHRPASGYAKVVLDASRIELVHGRNEPGSLGGAVPEDRQLLGDLGVL